MEITAQFTERIEAIRGRLLMVDFSEDDEGMSTCRLHLTDDSIVRCGFNQGLADAIEKALRHEVVVFGVATIEANTGHILTLSIGELLIVDDHARTGAELAAAFAQYKQENDSASHLRQALREAMSGETYPVSELWDRVDNSDNDGS